MRTRYPWDDSLLTWWAECVDTLDRLTPRNRAHALSLIAEDIRQTLSTMPDKECPPPWLINQSLGCEVFELPPREWQIPDPGEKVRVIG